MYALQSIGMRERERAEGKEGEEEEEAVRTAARKGPGIATGYHRKLRQVPSPIPSNLMT